MYQSSQVHLGFLRFNILKVSWTFKHRSQRCISESGTFNVIDIYVPDRFWTFRHCLSHIVRKEHWTFKGQFSFNVQKRWRTFRHDAVLCIQIIWDIQVQPPTMYRELMNIEPRMYRCEKNRGANAWWIIDKPWPSLSPFWTTAGVPD